MGIKSCGLRPDTPTHLGRTPEINRRARNTVFGKFHRADPVAVDVEQRLRIVVVTANQIALGLEVHTIRHDLEDAGQFASAVLAVKRGVIKSIVITSFIGVPFR